MVFHRYLEIYIKYITFIKFLIDFYDKNHIFSQDLKFFPNIFLRRILKSDFADSVDLEISCFQDILLHKIWETCVQSGNPLKLSWWFFIPFSHSKDSIGPFHLIQGMIFLVRLPSIHWTFDFTIRFFFNNVWDAILWYFSRFFLIILVKYFWNYLFLIPILVSDFTGFLKILQPQVAGFLPNLRRRHRRRV